MPTLPPNRTQLATFHIGSCVKFGLICMPEGKSNDYIILLPYFLS